MSNRKTILIADDEIESLDFLHYTLENAGFDIVTVLDGIQAIKKMNESPPDLVILDIAMPNLEGTSVCEYIRSRPEWSELPVIFLTGKTDEKTEVNAFRLGADDFINKPIKPQALVSRIQSIMNRKSQIKQMAPAHFTTLSSLKIDHDNYLVFYKEIPVDLAKKEFKLIELLASKPGKVFTRKEIFSKIWGEKVILSDRTIDVHISKIRSKTSDSVIKTVKGIGFKMES